MTQKPIRISLPTYFAMGQVNTFLFLEPEPTLIDCGENSPQVWQALDEALASYGLQISDIKKVIITHAHVDHIGMASKITENSEAKIWVSELVYPWAVNLEQEWEKRSNLIDKIWQQSGVDEAILNVIKKEVGTVLKFWGNIPQDKIEVFSSEGELDFGGSTWQVIPALGHNPNQTCFYQAEEKWLLSADMLLPITPVPVLEIDPSTSERFLGLPKMMRSYQRLADLEIKEVFPGHGEVFIDHQTLINEQVTRIHQRKAACLELVKSGNHSLLKLAKQMYPNATGEMLFIGIAMTIGYLDLLINEGSIKRISQNDIWQFHSLN